MSVTLNILSRSIGRRPLYGARKVLHNTLKGLRELCVTVRFNEPIAAHRFNWIHDAPEAIIEAGFVGRPVIVGPNTAILPTDLPRFRASLHPQSVYLFPSEWPMTAWRNVGFKECQTKIWAAGVDIGQFKSNKRNLSDLNHVLIYFKSRSSDLLTRVCNLVRSCGYTFEIFSYGKYSEVEYKAALEKAKCGIWIAGTESQGFALMEALASGLPLIVLDVKSLSENIIYPVSPLTPIFSSEFIESGATSAPYFDETCGIKVSSNELDQALIEKFMQNIETFRPEIYIANGYSLTSSAQKLIDLVTQLPQSNSTRGLVLTPNLARALRYLDLAGRRWPWQLLGQRLTKKLYETIGF